MCRKQIRCRPKGRRLNITGRPDKMSGLLFTVRPRRSRGCVYAALERMRRPARAARGRGGDCAVDSACGIITAKTLKACFERGWRLRWAADRRLCRMPKTPARL